MLRIRFYMKFRFDWFSFDEFVALLPFFVCVLFSGIPFSKVEGFSSHFSSVLRVRKKKSRKNSVRNWDVSARMCASSVRGCSFVYRYPTLLSLLRLPSSPFPRFFFLVWVSRSLRLVYLWFKDSAYGVRQSARIPKTASPTGMPIMDSFLLPKLFMARHPLTNVDIPLIGDVKCSIPIALHVFKSYPGIHGTICISQGIVFVFLFFSTWCTRFM